ncbi:AEC family transporter [Lentibacillus saliphilus]|uniref:AEC family transporter n=1 Tax=Lentibacillus saliphilus TaxID=2737028 RepID=UPI001C300C76|nr:AEC family transporter [Lentibacillus saliphilus]
MGLFFSVILPIVSVFGAGYVLQRIRMLDVKSIAPLSIYIFLPALVFTSLYESTFNQGYYIILVFGFFILFAIILINKVLAKLFHWSPSVESASILTTAFMNGGNYGVPVILFAVGSEAMPYAIFYMVVITLLMNFFGVYYASRGVNGALYALKKVLKMPTTYATIAAFVMQQIPWTIPESVYGMLTMLSDAAIPIMMVLLGMQLASITSLKLNWQVISSAVSIRMIISPLLAFLFISVLDVSPIIGSVLLINAAMPSAATTTMLAIEFDTEPDLVSSITLATTLFSVVSVTVLLQFIA